MAAMKHIILTRNTAAGPEFSEPIECEPEHIQATAEVAAEMNWLAMYECSEPLDMAEVARTVQAGKHVFDLPAVVRLWDLRKMEAVDV